MRSKWLPGRLGSASKVTSSFGQLAPGIHGQPTSEWTIQPLAVICSWLAYSKSSNMTPAAGCGVTLAVGVGEGTFPVQPAVTSMASMENRFKTDRMVCLIG